jgi:hypothetical protein
MSTQRPYCLTMDGKLVDFFRHENEALAKAHEINKNRWRSSEGRKAKQLIMIIYDTPLETRIVHEE